MRVESQKKHPISQIGLLTLNHKPSTLNHPGMPIIPRVAVCGSFVAEVRMLTAVNMKNCAVVRVCCILANCPVYHCTVTGMPGATRQKIECPAQFLFGNGSARFS